MLGTQHTTYTHSLLLALRGEQSGSGGGGTARSIPVRYCTVVPAGGVPYSLTIRHPQGPLRTREARI